MKFFGYNTQHVDKHTFDDCGIVFKRWFNSLANWTSLDCAHQFVKLFEQDDSLNAAQSLGPVPTRQGS